jgi:hypothetical protein
LPNPPREVTEADYKASQEGKATSVINERIANDLGIPPGEISREALHDAIVEHFLAKGDPKLGKSAFFVARGIGADKSTQRARHGGELGREGGHRCRQNPKPVPRN